MTLWKRSPRSTEPVELVEPVRPAAGPPRFRVADQGDVAAVQDLGDRLLGEGLIDWAKILNAGSDGAHVILAERSDGTIGGMIGLTPIHIDAGQLTNSRKRDYGVQDYPWWKLRGLALEPDLRGHGTARELLRRAVEALPPEIVGIYGNVELDNLSAVAWYHRQGFHVAGAVRITGRGVPPMSPSAPGELLFRSTTKNLAEHLAGRGNLNTDARLLREDFKSLTAKHVRGRPDVGYRLFARRVAEEARFDNTCAHLVITGHPAVVLGWDPDHRRVCTGCQPSYTQQPNIVAHDTEDRCDGCGRRDPDVLLRGAALEDEYLIVYAGLCRTCRAGDLPVRA